MIASVLILTLVVILLTISLAKSDESSAGSKDTKVTTKSNKKKSTKDWNKINFDDVEKEWEKGDSADELELEYENSERIARKKQDELLANIPGTSTPPHGSSKSKGSKGAKKKDSQPASLDGQLPPGVEFPPGMPPGGPGGMMGGMMGGMGDMMKAQMWFTELHMVQQEGPKKGKPWTKNDMEQLCQLIAAKLRSAHLAANVYNLGPSEKKGKGEEESKPTILVSIDKAWQAKDVLKFIATHPEVDNMTKDGRVLTANDYPDDDDDDE